MRKTILIILLITINSIIGCKEENNHFSKKLDNNESNKDYPFGKANEKAPKEIKDFDLLIGDCTCKSLQYNAKGLPGDTIPLKWKWRYILNGNGVQDDGWYGNDTIQSAFTSIRILNPQTKKWQVPFFTPNMTSNPSIWNGGKEDGEIILRRPYKVQDSIEVVSTLTFSSISNQGFNWVGESFFPATNSSNVFWKIWCKKE
tara:strand:- start:36200 stop:36802 length:603 start_codon:yes stop_codon:yes gene_type:complete